MRTGKAQERKKKKSIPEKESPLLNAKIEQKLGTDSS